MKRTLILVLALLAVGGAVAGRMLTRVAPDAAARNRAPEEKVEGSKDSARTAPAAPKPGSGEGGLRLRVAGEDAPLSGTKVTIVSEDRPDPPRTFVTRPDGAQEMAGMPEGEYAVVVHHPGYVPQGQRVQVRAGEIVEVAFLLKKGAGVQGVVRDPEGRPVPETSVALLNPRDREVLLPALAVRTGPDGRYSILGIPVGEYLLDFRHPRFRPLVKEGATFRSPEDRLVLDAALQRGFTVSGRIIDMEGRPIERAKILAMNEESSGAESGPEGKFIVFGLGDRSVTLRAEAPEHGIVFAQNVRPGATDVDIRLPKAATISGRVVVDPLPPAFGVRLWKFEPGLGQELGQQYHARIGKAGEFAVQNLAPADYRLEIEAEGYEALDRPTLSLRAGQDLADIIIRMRRKP